MSKIKDHLMDIEDLVIEAYVDLGLTDYDEIVEFVQESLDMNNEVMASVETITALVDDVIAFVGDYNNGR
jgi:hypothetical protein